MAFSILLFLLVVGGASDPETRFLEEYPQAAARLEADQAKVKGTAVLGESNADRRRSSGKQIIYVVDGSTRKFEYSITKQVGRTEQIKRYVFCEAGPKSFQLVRPEPEKPYIIHKVGLKPIDSGIFDQDFFRYLNAPYRIFGSRLIDLLNEKNFRLHHARSIDVRGDSIIEVKFEAGSFNGQPNHFRARLDPKRSWAIVSSEFRLGSETALPEILDVEYRPVAGLPIVPLKVRRTYGEKKELVCEFGQMEFISTPASEFTLECYGLKDVTRFAPENARAFRWWWPVAGVGLLLGAWVLKRFATRQ